MGAPWANELESFNFNVLSVLSKADDWTDKCLHTVVKSDDPEKLLTVVFDFHRRLNVGNAITTDSLSSLIRHCSVDALKYFEDLAEGNRFDVQPDRSPEQLRAGT